MQLIVLIFALLQTMVIHRLLKQQLDDQVRRCCSASQRVSLASWL